MNRLGRSLSHRELVHRPSSDECIAWLRAQTPGSPSPLLRRRRRKVDVLERLVTRLPRHTDRTPELYRALLMFRAHLDELHITAFDTLLGDVPYEAFDANTVRALLIDARTGELRPSADAVACAKIREWTPLEDPGALLRAETPLCFLLRCFAAHTWPYAIKLKNLDSIRAALRLMPDRLRAILVELNRQLALLDAVDTQGIAVRFFVHRCVLPFLDDADLRLRIRDELRVTPLSLSGSS